MKNWLQTCSLTDWPTAISRWSLKVDREVKVVQEDREAREVLVVRVVLSLLRTKTTTICLIDVALN